MSADHFDDCAEVQAWALRRFVYTPDDANPRLPESELFRWAGSVEHWGTRKQRFDKAGMCYGDCDDFALMCWDALRDRGVEARLVNCNVNGFGHLVCAVDGWVLDNRYTSVMGRDELKKYHGYRFLSMSGTKPGEPWVATE